MDFLAQLLPPSGLDSSNWIVLAGTGTLGILIIVLFVFAMGAFGSKNHMPVEGRTVLVTGASEGMGRSAAIQLAAKGANVIVVSRSVAKLEAVVDDCKAAAKFPQTQRFLHISADVSEPEYAAKVVAEAKTWNAGRAPDIVWCVAGMSTPLLLADPDAMRATRRNMDVNFFGAAEMAHAILGEWLSAENATSPASAPKHLVFTASVLALLSIAGYGPYAPSKWALRALADTLAMELRLYPDNPVRVHVVCPATITSPGFARENATKPDVTRALEEDDTPQTPDEVASRAIRGLERGGYFVTVSWLGELMRCGIMGGSPRNNWVFDTLVGWIVPVIYFFVLWDMNGKVSGWARKHGHPSTYARKEIP